MCQYQLDDTASKEIKAVVFCLSLCHRENILMKTSVDNAEFRAALYEVILKSKSIKK
jgi:hypothetical protein